LEIAVAHARFEYRRRAACGNKEPGSPAGNVRHRSGFRLGGPCGHSHGDVAADWLAAV